MAEGQSSGRNAPLGRVLVTAAAGTHSTVVDGELLVPESRRQIMGMPVTLRRYTVDEVDRFPPDGNRYELRYWCFDDF